MTEYKVYLDSDVFISYVREEIDNAFNLRFEESRSFLALCSKHKITVVLSDAFFKEVKHITGLDKDSVLELTGHGGLNVELVNGTEKTEKTATSIRKKTGIHKSDAIHVSLALESGCRIIITWNRDDFEKTCGFIDCAAPKDFASGFSDTHQQAGPYPQG